MTTYHSNKMFVPYAKFISMLDKLFFDNGVKVKDELIDKFGQLNRLPRTIKRDKNGEFCEMIEVAVDDIKYAKELYEAII
jgi:hypothetical protein